VTCRSKRPTTQTLVRDLRRFVAKFDLSQSGANSLLYSSLFGAAVPNPHHDRVDAAATSPSAGRRISGSDTVNAVPVELCRLVDGFVTRFQQRRERGDLFEYLGGATSSDWVEAIAVDAAGRALRRRPDGGRFPTTAGAYDTLLQCGLRGRLRGQIDPTQSGAASAVYSTYLGGRRV